MWHVHKWLQSFGKKGKGAVPLRLAKLGLHPQKCLHCTVSAVLSIILHSFARRSLGNTGKVISLPMAKACYSYAVHSSKWLWGTQLTLTVTDVAKKAGSIDKQGGIPDRDGATLTTHIVLEERVQNGNLA